MAKVIPVGPIDPVLYGFAKKQAEKAERDPRYVPKRLETPAHSITYRRVGATVKAFVIDKIAPITFPTYGSAIPVAPSFLHLHPELPEKTHGREYFSTANGQTKNWGLVFNGTVPDHKVNNIGSAPFYGTLFVLAYTIDHSVKLATSSNTLFDAARSNWDGYLGEFPDDPIKSVEYFGPDAEGVNENNSAGQMSISRTSRHAISSTAAICDYYIRSAYSGFGGGLASLSVLQKYNMSYGSRATGIFLDKDIRLASQDFATSVAKIDTQCAQCKTEATCEQNDHGILETINYKIAQTSFSANIAVSNSAVAFDGSIIFPVLDVSAKWAVDLDHSRMSGDFTNVYDWSESITVSNSTDFSIGITKNLSGNRLFDKVILSERRVINRSTPDVGIGDDDALQSKDIASERYLFVVASIGGFDGVMLRAKIYDKFGFYHNYKGYEYTATGIYEYLPSGEKTQYAADSPLVKSRLAAYFDISQGEYRYSNAPHLEPPAITTDGICLPHAWFFCRENEARQGVFDANTRNHISVAVYPEDRHEFSVEDADIFSVELNHPPRFVARPGDAIEVSMRAVNGGNPLVPYVVHGLVDERDESGKPTGFYLAADGAISGSFEPSETDGPPTATFKLSPHQKLDAYRLISVETTTEREYGVQAHVEVLGDGVRVPPGPPAFTLECIEKSVLAGQAVTFYVTASHVASGSRVAYEIRRAGGAVSSSGHVDIAYGAGSTDYFAPHISIQADDSPSPYILVDPLVALSDTPSVGEFEFRLVHENAPAPVPFSVKYAHERYANSTDRPGPLPSPPLFYLDARVAHGGDDEFVSVSGQLPLVDRVWCSLKTKRVYVTFWDGQSCEVSNILTKNPNSGRYEFNPDWREVPFDYPPAADPYSIKGTLEPYVYAYEEYENNRTGA